MLYLSLLLRGAPSLLSAARHSSSGLTLAARSAVPLINLNVSNFTLARDVSEERVANKNVLFCGVLFGTLLAGFDQPAESRRRGHRTNGLVAAGGDLDDADLIWSLTARLPFRCALHSPRT